MNESSTGLYHPSFEHDNCGIGAIVNIKGLKTHKTIDDALKIVERLEHRAGMDAKRETGDGVGLLCQIPHAYFNEVVQDFSLSGDTFGVGMMFLPNDALASEKVKRLFEYIVKQEGLHVLGYRKVAINPKVLGSKAIEKMPNIVQCFIERPIQMIECKDFERTLYIVRRLFEKSNKDTYICSLSCKTIVYKGMFLVGQLRTFYMDLQDKRFVSAIALVHSRFSTNTNPSWERAHPNRVMVHNGEINTIRGNANKMLAREETMNSSLFQKNTTKVFPVVDSNGSDSSMLDNAIEFLTMAGVELPLAMMMCIPQPWDNDRNLSKQLRDFYQYHACLMEPWDGPASILFSDGDVMGALLDRNGLRPSRYYITKDGYMVLSSEVGVLDIPQENIVEKRRLMPGKMLLIDTTKQKILDDCDLKEYYASRKPYGEWLESNLLALKDLKIPNKKPTQYVGKELEILQKVHGYAYEDVKDYISTMALHGNEMVVAMGADRPLSMLDEAHQPLFHYFKQMFAQVTNPPIDALREEIITSTSMYLGSDGNLLQEQASNCRSLKIDNPILSDLDLLKIKNLNSNGFKATVLSMLYFKSDEMKDAIKQLQIDADKAIANGATILIVSDRGVDESHIALPSLLATSALNQYLIQTKKRLKVALIVESGEPIEVHHFATLLGYGASAINPYLVHDTIQSLIDQNLLDKDYYAAVQDFDHGVLHGVVKIASKMGISTIQAYQGSQIFEVLGLSHELVDAYFTGSISRVEGLSLLDLQHQQALQHAKVFDPLMLPIPKGLKSTGQHKFRSFEEQHLYNPKTIHLLQKATRNNDYSVFKRFSDAINKENESISIRGLLKIKDTHESIPMDEVESIESIVKRFKTGAMSYGSISKEAHETMAIAMNQLQGKSNSGEGGEDKNRFQATSNGTSTCSAIKQVASGRFGVTSEYLVSAKEIQIKMAQGAKPGEGGQLPASKVYPWIAKTRHSTPGVQLISPPPHHDIYSIEDLAQLIYDLKCASREASISVKLVSEAGVGTIASGVAKAGAEVILISGYDGGTGAAPKNSLYNAGLPWELGLSETHQTLIQNELRERVRLECDGKLLTGKDVVVACLLGAEEFGFATAPLVSMGCIMMRVCHQDTCPVGIATQNPLLRRRFQGKPEYVVNFMTFIAQEMREYMAQLGFRSVDEMVGKSYLLSKSEHASIQYPKISLDQVLTPLSSYPVFQAEKRYDFHLETTQNYKLLKKFEASFQTQTPHQETLHIDNLDRSFGTILGSEITKRFQSTLQDHTYTLVCIGSGGQSFGAFVPKGLTLSLEGDSNDYFGKGLSGGILQVFPNHKSEFVASENIIIGNVALYGATSGEAYIAGIAGERFGVRNSGVEAVVEGCGDHALEYMTGGKVLILGQCGSNVAAGMSGGIAYILDEKNTLYSKLNTEMVEMSIVSNPQDVQELRQMLNKHVQYTDSKKAKDILMDLESNQHKFKKIVPCDYREMMEYITQYKLQGFTEEEAYISAFNKKMEVN